MSDTKEIRKDPYAPLRDQMAEPPKHWRSTEHKDSTPEFVAQLDVEFASEHPGPEGINRREALKLAGASLALGSLAACVRRPEEEILPYTKHPESVIPGVRQNYATCQPRSEGAIGLLVEANEGRPTKIEGNPNHPASLGSSDSWAQAEVLKLYDPDRARSPLNGGKNATWEAWDAFAKDHFGKLATAGGKGLALLVEEHDAPTFDRLIKVLQAKMPEAKIHRWDPLGADRARAGAELAFGPGARVRTDLEKADVVLALDSDFLVKGPEHLRLARQFGKRRAAVTAQEAAQVNRLYCAEGTFTTTGACADHRVRVSSGQIGNVLKAVARELTSKYGWNLGEAGAGLQGPIPAGAEKFVAAVAKDLAANKARFAIVVGEGQPAVVHALAHAISSGSSAFSVVRAPGAVARTSYGDSLAALQKSLADGQVQTLVIFDANPVYTAPGAMKFGESLGKASTVVHVGLHADETGKGATWHLPAAHFLESWGDGRAWDGTASVVQPLILPLWGSRASISVLAQIAGHAELNDRKLVEETWRGAGMPLADKKAWRRVLHDGVIGNTAFPAETAEAVEKALSTRRAALGGELAKWTGTAPSKDAVELVAFHGNLLDGRVSNVTWLQELPDSMSKLCWDNALLVSPALAKELSIESGVVKNSYSADVVDVSVDGRTISAPVFVLPGLATYTVAMAHGYGKTTGEVAKGVGVSPTPLLSSATNVVQGVKLSKTGKKQVLCSTQDHFSVPGDPFKEMTFAQMSGAKGPAAHLGLGNRPLYLSGDAKSLAKGNADFARKADMPASLVGARISKSNPVHPKQMTDAPSFEGQQWGMVIDLSSCIGCNVCAVACVAENNIPAVGREQVLLGRELHWIRVDRYYSGDVDNPTAGHQPVPCMHCESAPCEPVCPVAATVHDEEGINSMAYNRCIGTRYCANNCPYKVRRFNYLDYTVTGNVAPDPVQHERMKSLKLQRNPDVTVRYRGIMEKCTYCTQRIEEAKIGAKRKGDDRKALPDGAVTPACAQACPTQAITFGNINDPNSRVARLKASDRNYEMLQELNIRPRTTFLARLKNENEELG